MTWARCIFDRYVANCREGSSKTRQCQLPLSRVQNVWPCYYYAITDHLALSCARCYLGNGGNWEGNTEEKLIQRITSYMKRQEALLDHLRQRDALVAARLAGEHSHSRKGSGDTLAATAGGTQDVVASDSKFGHMATKGMPPAEQNGRGGLADSSDSGAKEGLGAIPTAETKKKGSSDFLRSFIAVPEDTTDNLVEREKPKHKRLNSEDAVAGTQEISQPRVVNITSSSLTLHWTLKGSSKTKVPVFQVEWRRRSTQNPTKWCKWQVESTLVVGVDGSTGLFTKQGLRSGTAYQFRIRIHGAHGKNDSNWSEPSASTKTDADEDQLICYHMLDPMCLILFHKRAQKRSQFSVDMSTDALLNSNAGDGAVVHTAKSSSLKSSIHAFDEDGGAEMNVAETCPENTSAQIPARPEKYRGAENSISTTAEEPSPFKTILRAPSVDDDGNLLDQIAAKEVIYDDPPVCLGQGGFGIVLRSAVDGYNHRGDQITVAVKRVRPRQGRQDLGDSEQQEIMESMVEELHAEASMLAKLRHANIVSILAINLSPDEGPFLVMQFCNHGTLKEALHPKRRVSSAERRAAKGQKPKSRRGKCMLNLHARLVLAEQIASAVDTCMLKILL